MSSKGSLPLDASGLSTHLADLRRSYIEALPGQRLNIAKQRIQNPGDDPNRLVAHVSAVEGFIRSLCMHQEARTKAQKSALYPKYEKRGAVSLIKEYLEKKGLGNPEDHFGADTWQLFGYAVKYRNLLAHECTYLGLDKSPQLVDACTAVLRTLAKDAGLKSHDI